MLSSYVADHWEAKPPFATVFGLGGPDRGGGGVTQAKSISYKSSTLGGGVPSRVLSR